MTLDVNGNNTLPAVYYATPGTTVLSNQHNAPLEDLNVAVSAKIDADGRKAMTGPLTLFGDATTALQAVTLQQLQASLQQIQTISPKKFGTKGDLKYGETLTVTAGSSVAISSSVIFSPSDVGKTIQTQFGGASNAPVTTTIASYVGPTQITCATNFSTNSAGPFIFATDDTIALQNAINYAIENSCALSLGSDRYLTGTLTASGVFNMYGDGPNSSFIVLKSSTDSIVYSQATGNPYNLLHPSVGLRNFTVAGSFSANSANGLIDISFGFGGSPERYVMLDNVEIKTLGLGFACGISLNDCSGFSLRDVLVVGYGNILANSIGIRIDGESKAIDMYLSGCKIYFCDYGVQIFGRILFQEALEGVVFEKCVFLLCNTCIVASTTTPIPYLLLNGCNFNGYKVDVSLSNIIQYQIVNNLFYSVARTPVEASHNHILINNTATGPVSYSASQISGNIFSTANTSTIAQKNGISINATSSDTGCLIGSNTFIEMDYGVILYTGSKNVTIHDTNIYSGVATPVLGGGTNNIVASFGGGRHVDNLGIRRDRRKVSFNLDAALRAVITFPVAFKTIPLISASQSNASSPAANKPIVIDSETINGFQVYIPGAASGNNVTITYDAVGT